MMDVSTATPQELQRAGIALLTQGLGVAGMVRFLQQFSRGHGDYTSERHQWLDGLSMDDVIERMRKDESIRTTQG
jgi:hypothetical protein